MKKHKILIPALLLLLAISAIAQPLPPTTPSGNPVPIGEFISIILVIGTYFLVKKKKK